MTLDKKCNFCDGNAETNRGIIYVRANIKFNNLNKWINARICRDCWDVAHVVIKGEK